MDHDYQGDAPQTGGNSPLLEKNLPWAVLGLVVVAVAVLALTLMHYLRPAPESAGMPRPASVLRVTPPPAGNPRPPAAVPPLAAAGLPVTQTLAPLQEALNAQRLRVDEAWVAWIEWELYKVEADPEDQDPAIQAHTQAWGDFMHEVVKVRNLKGEAGFMTSLQEAQQAASGPDGSLSRAELANMQGWLDSVRAEYRRGPAYAGALPVALPPPRGPLNADDTAFRGIWERSLHPGVSPLDDLRVRMLVTLTSPAHAVTLRTGPGITHPRVGLVTDAGPLKVVGKAADSEGAMWYHVVGQTGDPGWSANTHTHGWVTANWSAPAYGYTQADIDSLPNGYAPPP